MSERDNPGGGGLTGATGDLTFEENDRPFVPGEAREVSDPAHQADVTAGQGAKPAEPPTERPDAESRIGGDEVTDHEEHL